MRNFTLVTASLLCSLSWISVSGYVSQTVEMEPGGEVTLRCTNFSTSPSPIYWFTVTKAKLHCICYMFKPSEPASFCDGFQDRKFEMSSNVSTVFLKIKQMDSSDAGLYFCGFYTTNYPVLVEATYVDVQGYFNVSDGTTKQTSIILGTLTVISLVVIIGLAVKIKKLQEAHVEEEDPQLDGGQGSEGPCYATVPFRPIPNQRPA